MIKTLLHLAPLLGVVVGVVVAADSIPRPWDDAKSNPCSLNLSDAKSAVAVAVVLQVEPCLFDHMMLCVSLFVPSYQHSLSPISARGDVEYHV